MLEKTPVDCNINCQTTAIATIVKMTGTNIDD